MKISKQLLVKWSGSKRSQSKVIVSYFPTVINRYYEPFCGSCAVMYELLNQIYLGNITCKKIICSDLNKDLINVYNCFMINKDLLFNHYQLLYNQLISYDNISDKKEFYFNVRNRYNDITDDNEKTYLFYWLLRTCYNGLVRYNKKGLFNSPYHLTRDGIKPEKLKVIFDSWNFLISDFISKGGIIEFKNESYEDVLVDVREDDFIYMDPPYDNTKGMYFCDFDSDKFFDKLFELNDRNVKYIVSYDGLRNENNKTGKIPKFYNRHLYIDSGNSSFNKLKKGLVYVYESMYLNY